MSGRLPGTQIDDRQRLAINRLLDGVESKHTTSKYAANSPTARRTPSIATFSPWWTTAPHPGSHPALFPRQRYPELIERLIQTPCNGRTRSASPAQILEVTPDANYPA